MAPLPGMIRYNTDNLYLERSTNEGTSWTQLDLSGATTIAGGPVDRVVETATTRTIADTQSLTVATYFSIQGTGSLTIQGDGALLVI